MIQYQEGTDGTTLRSIGMHMWKALSRAAFQEGVPNVSGSIQQTCFYFITFITEKQRVLLLVNSHLTYYHCRHWHPVPGMWRVIQHSTCFWSICCGGLQLH